MTTNQGESIKLILLGPDMYLACSVLLETLSTCCLQHTLQNNLYYIPAYIGYGISFYLFPKALTKYPLNVAYTIWSGIGILLTTVYVTCMTLQLPTIQRMIGMMFVVLGICLTNE